MRIKKFQAPSMAQAMLQIKQELGNNAVILKTRELSGGIFRKFLVGNLVEVTAATDDDFSLGETSFYDPKMESTTAHSSIIKESDKVQAEISQLGYIHQEISSIRQILSTLAGKDLFGELKNLPNGLLNLYRILKNQEVQDPIILELLKEMELTLTLQELEDSEKVLASLGDLISKRLNTKPEMILNEKPQIIVLVGPTGVGKTTTIAKLAAYSYIIQKQSVAILTLDTYRIGAVEQLATYARIMGVPFRAIQNPEEFNSKIAEFSGTEKIFIDTVGRSPRDLEYLQALEATLRTYHNGKVLSKPLVILLVLSLTTKWSDLLDIYYKYSSLPLSACIFTKADETAIFGSLLNFCHSSRIPITHITNGQNVPKDIIKAQPEKLSKWILSSP